MPGRRWCRCATACGSPPTSTCRTAPARSRPCSCACPTTRTAATAGCRSWPRTSSRAATRSCRRTCAASSARRASRSRSSTRSPDGYDTIEWIAQQPWSNGDVGMWGDSYYGFTQWAAVAAAAPRAQGDRPARHDRRHRRLARGRDAALRRALPGRVLDRRRHARVDARLEPPAARRGVRRRVRGDRPALGLVRLRARALARRARASRSSPTRTRSTCCASRRCTASGWFDNITPPHMLDYEALIAEPRDGAVPVPPRGLDRPRELPLRARADPRVGGSRPRTTTRSSGCCRATSAPALDFFDAFLTGRADPAAVPRVRWHLPHVGWQESPSWPPPGAAELRLYLAGAERAAADEAGRHARPGRRRARRGDAGCTTPRDLVPSTLVNPFAALYEYPDERAIESRPDVLTFTTPRLGRARDARRPRRRAPRGDERRALAVPARQARRRAPRRPRAHAAVRPDRARAAPGELAEVYLGHTGYRVEPGHRLRLHVASSDFPVFLPHPGTAENPWDATTTRTNRHTLATGGEQPSYVSLTALPAAG